MPQAARPSWATSSSGTPPEEYAANFAKLKEDAGPGTILVQHGGSTLRGFDPASIKLVNLSAPKEMSEAQVMTGGLDELGQAFIQLLLKLRPPAF